MAFSAFQERLRQLFRRAKFDGGVVSTSTPVVEVVQTWNNAGVTFVGKTTNITDTASASESLIEAWQVGGVTKAGIGKRGQVCVGSGLNGNNLPGSGFSYDAGLVVHGDTSSDHPDGYQMVIKPTRIGINTNAALGWMDMSSYGSVAVWVYDGSNTIAQRNSTNAQTYRTYGTYTDGSNYRRLTQTMSTAGVAEIKPEGAGTGASGNVLHISGLPTSNPGAGILWNDGGTVKVGTAAWSPLSLWPNGILSPGMWISPRDLTSQWQDYLGTTPVATPGTVADSSNPVGLALDIRAGATVLTDPGNHMLQSTSAARPLLSARVNLLTYSQEFTLGTYNIVSCTMEADSLIAPDGTLTADSYLTNAGHGRITNSTALPAGSIVSGVQYTMSVYCKNISGSGQFFIYCGNSPGGSSPTLTATTSWQRFTWTFTANSTGNDIRIVQVPAAGDLIAVWGAQVNIGPTALPYQPILTGSTYPSTDFPVAQLYDGVDDGMATAAFSAGTLINGMDCQIPVRLDSAASCVAGLYNGVADATKFFGMAESASGSGCVGSGAGTPTVWVDNTQLTGGTAVTRGTLHTALTGGDWHILEFRNLDLSTWTAAGFGLYTSYLFPGPRGDILLYPSTTPTTDKDAARQWLADYYGVTLP